MRRKKDTAPDVAADLRTLTDLAEQDEFVAKMLGRVLAESLWPRFSSDDEPKAAMAQAIRAFKTVATSIEKSYWDAGVGYLRVTVTLPGGTVLTLTDERESVCTRVVAGTREVVEEIADPDALAALPKVTRTRVEEIVEWQCEPLLGSVPA